MIRDLVPLLAGAALAALLAPGALRAFAEAGWKRPNHRGVELPLPAGVIAVAAGIVALGALRAVEVIAEEPLLNQAEGSFLVLFGSLDRAGGFGLTGFDAFDPLRHALLFVGVALLGLVDDLFEGAPRGLRGHGTAILRGGFSTGALKALGTVARALAVVTPVRDVERSPDGAQQPFAAAASIPEYLLAAALVVLATNFFNSLDLRPGRSAKAFVLLGAGLLVATGDTEPVRTVGAFAGPMLVLGLYDLRERAMLGDTGSNLLGAMAGVWLVLVLDTTGQAIAAGVLLVLTLYGEFRSITATIERVAPLRLLDELGRPKP